MPKVDIEAVLREKAPRASRWIPRFAVNWLRRTIHEKEINHIIGEYWQQKPQEFIQSCFRFLRVDYSISGLEALDPAGRYLFVSNHPFGGMDGMMLADELIKHFGDVRVVVNDILMHIEPLAPLWLPVNKHGAQNQTYARRIDDALAGDLPVLTFPAGLCSRRIGGEVQDLPWRMSFLKKACSSERAIVPVFVEGELSPFFYRVDSIRRKLGIKFNIEMLWLSDEMFRQEGRSFRIVVGEPIAVRDLQHLESLAEQVAYVRAKTYDLRLRLKK